MSAQAAEIRHITFTSGGGTFEKNGQKIQFLIGEPIVGSATVDGQTLRFGFFNLINAVGQAEPVAFDGRPTDFDRPVLRWKKIGRARSYIVEWADNPRFDNSRVVGNVPTNHFRIPTSLPNGTYYWRVRGLGTSGPGPFSAVDSFRILRLDLGIPELAFGNGDVGSSQQLSFVLTNPSNSPLHVRGVSLIGADAEHFSTDLSEALVVESGRSKEISVTFAPLSAGKKTARLQFDSGERVFITLTGNGVAAVVSLEGVDFGTVDVGETSQGTVTITNRGPDNLAISTLRIRGTGAPAFSVAAGSRTVPPGQSRVITVTFAPREAGDVEAELIIGTDSPDSTPAVVQLRGSGNSAPFVDNAIEDRVLILRQESYAQNLESHPRVFRDADGDALMYTVTNSRPEVATVTLTDNLLTVDPLKRGRTRILVEAEDLQGLTAQTAFVIVVTRPPTLPHIAVGEVPTIDGDVSDWEALFPGSRFESDLFASIRGAVKGEVDATDQAIEVWMGWNTENNSLYLAARVEDDVFATNSDPTDPTKVGLSDAMEIFLDADRSGGAYTGLDPQAQHYVLNPEGTQGPVLFPMEMTDPPFVEAAVQQTGTTTVYEWCIPGWDTNVTASTDIGGGSSRHEFLINEVIGLGLGFADFDSNADADNGSYRAYNSLFAKRKLTDTADRFCPFRLGPPKVRVEKAVAAGADVMVELEVPPDLETASVSLEFSNIDGAGTTELNTSSDGEDPPDGFRLSDAPVYYDIETTATFTGPVEVCFNYGGTSLEERGGLALFHFDDATQLWEDITTSIDEANTTICGEADSFSAFGVFQEELDPPTLVTFDGGTVTDFTPTLDWSAVTDADTYDLEYDTDAGFNTSTTIADIATNTYTFPAALADATYYWRVKAKGDGGEESAFSTTDSFVLQPAVPTLVAEVDITDPVEIPTLEWDDIDGAATYTLEYDTDAAFGNPTTEAGLATSEFTFASALGFDTYYWRVKAVGTGGLTSDFSADDDFVVTLAVPDPVLLAGVTQQGQTPTLDWDDVAGAASYSLDYSTDAFFAAPTEVTGIGSSEYTFPGRLLEDTYYWRVKAVAAGGTESGFSNTDSFVIIPTLAEWAMILLAATMLGYGVWYQRRLV